MDPSFLGQLQEGSAILDRNQSFFRLIEKASLQLPINPGDVAFNRSLRRPRQTMRSAFFFPWLCGGRAHGDPLSSPCDCESHVDASERDCSAETCVSLFFSGATCVQSNGVDRIPLNFERRLYVLVPKLSIHGIRCGAVDDSWSGDICCPQSTEPKQCARAWSRLSQKHETCP